MDVLVGDYIWTQGIQTIEVTHEATYARNVR